MKQFDINYIRTKDGKQTVVVNDYLLHSKYNPLKEAEQFIKKEINLQSVNVIFGHGLGYIAQVLKAQQFDDEKIIFIEPIKDFEQYNLTSFDVIFSTNIEIIGEAIDQKLRFLSKKINVICAPNYDNIFPEMYRDILKKVKDLQNLNMIYENTIRSLSVTWQENSIRNMLYTHQSLSLNELENYYNCPIVVASGGPSLTKQLPLLKKIRESIVLIAAGSTIGTLMANDIEPDYIVTIDGSELNYTLHFKELKLKKTDLLFSSTSHYKIQESFPNSKFAFLDTKEIKYADCLEKKLNKKLPNILGGGSVANFCLSISRFISSHPVAIIGQDLAYTDGKTHAENNKNSQIADEHYLARQGAFKIEGYFGTPVITDYSLFSMKESFEEIMKQIDGPDSIYNCTEGGVKINNMKQISFNDFVDRFVDLNKKVLIYKKCPNAIDYNKYILEMRKDLAIYNDILAELKKASRALEKNTLKTEFAPNILKTLDTVDENVRELMKKVVMERINDPITLDVMTKYEAKGEETLEERYTRIYKQNEELYERLYKATEQSIQYTKDTIQEAERLMEEMNNGNE